MSSPLFIHGVQKNSEPIVLKQAIEQVFLESTSNLSWLKPGDLVLLKPAINSPDPYPSTTHPFSVSVIARILREHGARVIIGDQSGIEHVVHGPKGIIKGETRKNFEASGMSQDANSAFMSFEQGGWDEGFDHFESNQTTSWKNGFYITNWIQKADHIINLPRLSAHAQAGVTLGFKNMVGILREDSRMEFHANGPFNSFIAKAGKDSGIQTKNDQTNAFIEKIVEISLAIKDKLRLTLFTAVQAQTTFGPDRHILPFLSSHVVTPRTGLIFASADPVAVETFAISYLTELYKSETPAFQKILQRILIKANGRIKELGTDRAIDHPFIKHAVKLGLGVPTADMRFTEVGDVLKERLKIVR